MKGNGRMDTRTHRRTDGERTRKLHVSVTDQWRRYKILLVGLYTKLNESKIWARHFSRSPSRYQTDRDYSTASEARM